jgi:membrane dipeptidase
MIAAVTSAARDNPEVLHIVRQRDDIKVPRERRIAVLLMLEGVEAIGYDPKLFEVFWQLGIRVVSLTWNRRNPYADGAAESGGGLSRLGQRLVSILTERGAVIDLVHASEPNFWDVMDQTSETPLMCSHACCRALSDHPRNLSDPQLRAIAGCGGLFGLAFVPFFYQQIDQNLDGVINHLTHAIDIMGLEHVALGSDFYGQIARALNVVPPSDTLAPAGLAPDASIPGLSGPAEFPELVQALLRRGYSPGDIRAVTWENAFRFFEAALPASER